MQHWTRRILISASILLIPAMWASALEIGAEVWVGNLGFRTDRISTDVTFPGAEYFWGPSIYAIQPLADNIRFEGGFYSDPVLRNISYTLFSYTEKMLTIGVGPFFGFFNDLGILLKSGISTAVKVEIPGIIFVGFRSDSTIGGELLQVGDYMQERTEVSLGFYVKNVICSLILDTKKFTQVTDAAKVVDSLTEYAFKTDIFQKNVPYRVGVDFAFQTLSKSYFSAAPVVTNTVNSIVLGAEMDLSISDAFAVYASFEGSVYSFGQNQLLGSTTTDLLFRASTGLRLNLDTLAGLSKIY